MEFGDNDIITAMRKLPDFPLVRKITARRKLLPTGRSFGAARRATPRLIRAGIAALAFVFPVFTLPALAQSGSESALSLCPNDRNVPNGVAAKLDASLRMFNDGQADTVATFGYAPGAELFVRAPDWTYHRSVGTADLATGTALVCGAPFQIGSNTKMMTAAVLMQLVEEGLVSLDDLLASHLPEIAAALPNGGKMTIRQLANHTSGIFSYTDAAPDGAPGIMEGALSDPNLLGKSYTPDDMVRFAIDHGVPTFEPGADGQWAYSNTGYVLIGMLLEKTAGQPLENLFQDRLFEPLGMKNTFLWNASPKPEFGLPRSYYQAPFDIETTGWNMVQGWAAGGVISTSVDMDLFMRGLIAGRVFKDPATLTSMMAGGPAGSAFVQYGIGIGEKPGGFWGHGGQTLGFESDIGMFRDADISLVVWTNSARNLAALGSIFVLGALGEADALQKRNDALSQTRWVWTSSVDGNGQILSIGEPDRYSIFFQKGGDLALGADCNRVLGRYTVEDQALSLEMGPATKALCPPDSLEDSFLTELQGTTAFERDGDRLVLSSEPNGQRMEFVLRAE